MKKIIRNNVIGFVLAGLLCGAVTVISASQNLSSSSVEYKNGNSVEEEINALYSKVNQLPKRYQVGDKITLHNEDYYIIDDSPRSQDYVLALKATPLTVDEVNLYGGVGTESNHVNKNTSSSVGTAYNSNGYGGLAYYSSPTCGYVNGSYVHTGCASENTSNYDSSDIKYVVDNWVNSVFEANDLKVVNGYKARLPQKEELRSKFYPSCSKTAFKCSRESVTPLWISESNKKYFYWTMTKYGKTDDYYGDNIYAINGVGELANVTGGNRGYYSNNTDLMARPVINVYKTAIEN